MKTRSRKAAAWSLAMGLFLFSGTAMSTNGYFTHGVGTQSKGMAGTGVGSNADMGTIMTASNPALGVFVDDSWEIGLSIFSPRRSYAASASQLNGGFIDLGGCDPTAPDPAVCLPSHTIAEGKIDSSSEWFPIPYVAKNWSLSNDRNISVAFYGRGGMNTDWDSSNASATSYFCGATPTGGPATGPGPYCAGVAGVDLSQAFLSVNYSGKIGENFAWGIGPILGIQLFEAKGVQTFQAITETLAETGDITRVTSLSNNGHETSAGGGVAVGLWWGINDNVSVGLSYQSKLLMGLLDDYSDLFAEDGDFDIPSSLKAGISVRASDSLRVNFDIEHTSFSEVDAVGNPMIFMFGCPLLPFGGTSVEACLGGESGPGFGWDDMTTFKLGFEWQRDDMNTWRFGYSYGEQPIQAEDVLFNVLAPGVMEQHLTLGLTRQASNGGQWNFSFMYAPEKSVVGPSLFDPSQTIDLSMSQFEFEVAYSF
ncbi:MAG: outer membrane protein transport protein [Gammaproteobacteria bacterium]|nr:outer membrane protein transport protein [Gammaproteobacteria bacterium]